MTTLRQVVNVVETLYPLRYAESWDAPDYGKANAFRALAETHGTHFIEIKYPGQIIKI